jgi:hypothetical protein
MLKAEWRERPPAHWLIASFLGYSAPEKPKTAKELSEQARREGYLSIDELKEAFKRNGGLKLVAGG